MTKKERQYNVCLKQLQAKYLNQEITKEIYWKKRVELLEILGVSKKDQNWVLENSAIIVT